MDDSPCLPTDEMQPGTRPGAWGREPVVGGPVWLAVHVQRSSGSGAPGKASKQRQLTKKARAAAEVGSTDAVDGGADAAPDGGCAAVVAVRAQPSVEKVLKAAAVQGGLLKKREVDRAQLYSLDLESTDPHQRASTIRTDADARAILVRDGLGVVIVPDGGDLQPISEATLAAMRSLGLEGRAKVLDEARLARKLARDANAAQATEEEEHVPVLFWKDTDRNGYLSNWAKSPLVVKGKAFNCVEQYIMWSKAVIMGDDTREAEILATTDPQRQKKLGRSVHPWHEGLWTRHRAQVLYTAVNAKFSQNEQLRRRLLATYPRPMAEASPSDKVYGIGIAPDDPRAQDPANWHGENLLGRVLEQVRAELWEEDQSTHAPGE